LGACAAKNLILDFAGSGMEEGITRYRFEEHILPMARRLANSILEMEWEARLNPMNHSRLFPTVVTALVDSFPIEVHVGF